MAVVVEDRPTTLPTRFFSVSGLLTGLHGSRQPRGAVEISTAAVRGWSAAVQFQPGQRNVAALPESPGAQARIVLDALPSLDALHSRLHLFPPRPWVSRRSMVRGVAAEPPSGLRWSARAQALQLHGPVGPSSGLPWSARVWALQARVLIMPRSLAADAGLYWPVSLSWPLVGWTTAIRQSALLS